MIAELSPTLQYATQISMWILSLSVVLACYRIIRGPSLPDRILALDLIAVLVIGIIGVYCVMMENLKLMDLATVLALMAFVGTIAFSRYVEKSG